MVSPVRDFGGLDVMLRSEFAPFNSAIER